MNSTVIRGVVFLVTLVLVLVLPWVVSLIILIGLTIYFPFYLELLFFGFLVDTLYGSQSGFFHPGLCLALGFLLLTIFVRTRIRV
jgi:hypothetical protein